MTTYPYSHQSIDSTVYVVTDRTTVHGFPSANTAKIERLFEYVVANEILGFNSADLYHTLSEPGLDVLAELIEIIELAGEFPDTENEDWS